MPTGFYAVADEVITTDVFDNLLALLEAPFDHFGRVYSTPEDDAGARALANETLLPLAILLAYWDQTGAPGRAAARRRRRAARPPRAARLGRPRRVDHTARRPPVRDDAVVLVQRPRRRHRRQGGGRGDVGVGAARRRRTRAVRLGQRIGGPEGRPRLDLEAEHEARRAGDRRRPRVGLRRRQRRGRPDGADRSAAARRSRAAMRRPPTVPCRATSCSAASRSGSRWPRCTPRPRTRAVLSIFGTRIELGSVTVSLVIADHGVEIKVLARESALVVQKSDGDGFVAAARPRQRHPHAVRAGHRHRLHAVAAAVPRRRERPAGHDPDQPRGRSDPPAAAVPRAGRRARRCPRAGPASRRRSARPSSSARSRRASTALGFEVALADSGATPSIGFKAPSGVGLLIDAEIVTGGGYLFHDAASGQYAGVLQLDFKGITLQAIGLHRHPAARRQPRLLAAAVDRGRRLPADRSRLRLPADGRRRHRRLQAHGRRRAAAGRAQAGRPRQHPVPDERRARRAADRQRAEHVAADQGRPVPRGGPSARIVWGSRRSSRSSWRSSSRATRRGGSSSSASCGPPCPEERGRSSSCAWTPSGSFDFDTRRGRRRRRALRLGDHAVPDHRRHGDARSLDGRPDVRPGRRRPAPQVRPAGRVPEAQRASPSA